MPLDDWLCQKLENFNTVVADGYRSRAQDSAGLKKGQFVKVPKSQSRWYQMHTIKPDGPHRPGKTLFVYAFPPSGSTHQVGCQGDGSGPSKNDSHCAGLAQHAFVLGPGQSISSDSLHASSATGSGATTFQQDSSLRSQEPKPACLAPRASIIHEQGFYCVNTSYPMDKCLSGRHGPARQTSEKDVLCLHRPGRPSTVHSPDGV